MRYNPEWRLSKYIMVSCGGDCDACNYCDECNQDPSNPGPCERCPCGTNLNAAKTVFTGPTGLYCAPNCIAADLDNRISTLQEYKANFSSYYEEVDTESIGLRMPDEARQTFVEALYATWGHDLKGANNE